VETALDHAAGMLVVRVPLPQSNVLAASTNASAGAQSSDQTASASGDLQYTTFAIPQASGDAQRPRVAATVWKSACDAVDEGDAAAAALSQWCGRPGTRGQPIWSNRSFESTSLTTKQIPDMLICFVCGFHEKIGNCVFRHLSSVQNGFLYPTTVRLVRMAPEFRRSLSEKHRVRADDHTNFADGCVFSQKSFFFQSRHRGDIVIFMES
jgi:hypothetical protein